MSIAQLRAFHHVAAAGGFSQAAREIAVSQSTLSGHVRQLEQVSGTTLFERKQRGVALTPEGHALFEITSRLFAAEAEARGLLKDESGRIGGHLRVIADGAALPLAIVAKLRDMRPRLTFSLSIANSARVIAQLLEYRADVGVTAQLPSDSRLHARKFSDVGLCACVGQAHGWSDRSCVAMADLDGMAFVLRERGSRTREIFEENLVRHGVALGPVTEVSTQDGVREAVAAGFGLGVCATIDAGHDSRLHVLPIVDADIALTEYGVCLEERRRLPLVLDFFAAMERLHCGAGPEKPRF
ncbi:LysR family transcriptional regulator [Kaustia mangrovi]|uniref:LysR family transcriptional regulator n=1 Tax=Kaustia mangrovi TaxID=2593653 RepID=A0A7S8C3R8_9HYPH|nr:LysR family transcriptional regulator [Kaustia mangrovi]QPC42844.1 LysR family transcriptional regulator [Kaustia mangrovi]